MKTPVFSLLIMLTFFSTGSAVAGTELNYNLYDLTTQAQLPVDNDIMTVTLSSNAHANQAIQAAQTINQEMSWAFDILRKQGTDITYRTMNYQTVPHYKNAAIIGWSAHQELQLESRNFKLLSHTIGLLQNKLKITSMLFSASSEKREKAVKDLTVQALTAFQDKARLVTKTMGAREYRIVSARIEDSPRPYSQSYGLKGVAMASPVPSVEAGESKIIVSITGKIQLIQ